MVVQWSSIPCILLTLEQDAHHAIHQETLVHQPFIALLLAIHELIGSFVGLVRELRENDNPSGMLVGVHQRGCQSRLKTVLIH